MAVTGYPRERRLFPALSQVCNYAEYFGFLRLYAYPIEASLGIEKKRDPLAPRLARQVSPVYR